MGNGSTLSVKQPGKQHGDIAHIGFVIVPETGDKQFFLIFANADNRRLLPHFSEYDGKCCFGPLNHLGLFE